MKRLIRKFVVPLSSILLIALGAGCASGGRFIKKTAETLAAPEFSVSSETWERTISEDMRTHIAFETLANDLYVPARIWYSFTIVEAGDIHRRSGDLKTKVSVYVDLLPGEAMRVPGPRGKAIKANIKALNGNLKWRQKINFGFPQGMTVIHDNRGLLTAHSTMSGRRSQATTITLANVWPVELKTAYTEYTYSRLKPFAGRMTNGDFRLEAKLQVHKKRIPVILAPGERRRITLNPGRYNIPKLDTYAVIWLPGNGHAYYKHKGTLLKIPPPLIMRQPSFRALSEAAVPVRNPAHD